MNIRLNYPPLSPSLASTCAIPSTVSASIASVCAVVWAATNSANRLVVGSIRCVGVGIGLADTPVITSSVLAIVGRIVGIPLFTVHGAVDSLRLVVVTQDIDDNLVADGGLCWGSRRMATIVSSLSSTGGCTGRDSIVVCLNLGEREELVSEISVGIGYWVIGSIYRASQLHRTAEAGLGRWSCVLVVPIATRNYYMEVICERVSRYFQIRRRRLTSPLSQVRSSVL